LAGLGSADPAALKRAAEWANRPATTAPLGRYGWQKQSSITRPRPLRLRISKRASPRWGVGGPQTGALQLQHSRQAIFVIGNQLRAQADGPSLQVRAAAFEAAWTIILISFNPSRY